MATRGAAMAAGVTLSCYRPPSRRALLRSPDTRLGHLVLLRCSAGWNGRSGWLLPVLAVATTLALGPAMSLARLTEPASYRGDDRWESVTAIVNLIPEGATEPPGFC